MKKIIVFFLLSMFFWTLCLAEQFNSKTNNTLPYHPIRKVLLVVAMNKEAAPIIKQLNLRKSLTNFPGLPMQSYQGDLGALKILLVTNGEDPMYGVQNVGSQPAVLTTYLGIEKFHPDLIISIGTAGGITQGGAQVGDIYVSKKIYFYDRRIPVGNYRNYGLGRYPSFNLGPIAKKFNLKEGIICSGDSFDDNKTDTEIILRNQCNAVEMEAAGVAWVSMLMKIPMVAIKGITDLEGTANGHEQFLKNFAPVTKKLAVTLKNILFSLSKKVD